MKVFSDLYNKLFKKEKLKELEGENTSFVKKYSSIWMVQSEYPEALKMLKKIKENAPNLSQKMLEKVVVDVLYLHNSKKIGLFGVRHFLLNAQEEQEKDRHLIGDATDVLYSILCSDNTPPLSLNVLNSTAETYSLEVLAFCESVKKKPLFEKGVSVWQKILTEKHFSNSYEKYLRKMEETPHPCSYFQKTMFSENENGTCLFEQFLRLCPQVRGTGTQMFSYVQPDFVQTYLNLCDPSDPMVWKRLNPLREFLQVLTDHEYVSSLSFVEPSCVALRNFEERLSVHAMQEQLTKVVDAVDCSKISSKKRKM